MKTETLINTTLGLVLSGGGVKGMAHIGLLKALNSAVSIQARYRA